MKFIKKYPKVSVVMPSYNSKELLRNCLQSLFKTKYPNFEVVVVDDGSTDGSYEYLQKLSKTQEKLKVVKNDRNYGPSVTRNNGIENSDGKYICFYETDMEVDPDWMTPLVQTLEENSELGGVQSKILDINQRDYIHSTGVWYDPHTFWVLSFACGSYKNEFNENTEIGLGSVGSMYRKSILDKLGGFDEKIVHNIDDIELGWRVWMLGYKCITVPKSITYHWTGKPLGLRAKITPSFSSEFHFQKTPRIFLKNYEWKNVLKYLPWVLMIFFIRSLKNLFQGNSNTIRAFFKSIIWNLVNLSDTLKQRNKIQSLRKKPDEYLFDHIGLKGNFFDVYVKQILPRLYFAMSRFKLN